MWTHKQQWLYMRVKDLFETLIPTKQTLTFNTTVQIRTIPSREDLEEENLISELWYSDEDFKDFKKIAYQELYLSNNSRNL
jgi:hypothetical protein